MKQKLKVTSLFSKKSIGFLGFPSRFLFVMWWLFMGVVLPISVWAESTFVVYTWVNDNMEVLYDASFITGNVYGGVPNIWDEMHMEWDSFYIKPRSVIVNNVNMADVFYRSNSVSGNVYWSILWWNDNSIGSDNVTIVAWRKNVVNNWNDSATILWWNRNMIQWWDSFNPAVMLWWSGNKILNGHSSSVIIWWINNEIWNNVSNSAILWWKNNRVLGMNAILWGSWITVRWNIRNLFVFSDGNNPFQPGEWGAFYFYVSKGVWINTWSFGKWVSVKWSISFGEIDINSYSQNCTTDDLWVQWARSGCLVWCTRASLWRWWELLESSEACKDLCRSNSKCITPDEGEYSKNEHNSACIWLFYTGNATMCTSRALLLYKNVMYETKLIGSDVPCPINWDNKCIFKCISWAYLTWDFTWRIWLTWCYKNCDLPWSSTWQQIRHNEVVTWYNLSDAYCVNGVGSGDNCSSHGKRLVCSDGVLYISRGWSLASPVTAESLNYTNSSCILHTSSCDTNDYNLLQNWIVARDTVTWNDSNRSVSIWEKWKYELCIDYNVSWYGSGDWCNEIRPYHYKLIQCQQWYSTWEDHPYECRQMCDFAGSHYSDWETIMGYTNSYATCPNVCSWAILTCINGNWSGNYLKYNKKECRLSNKVCSSDVYNVSQSVKDQKGSHSIYDSCQIYTSSGSFTCNASARAYHLTWCYTWYHTEYNWPIYGMYCTGNSKSVACVQSWAPAQWAQYLSWNVMVYWQGSWGTWNWTSPSNCSWRCVWSYHTWNSGNTCDSNWEYKQCSNSGYKPTNSQWEITYSWVQWWNPVPACNYRCNTGYCGTSCNSTWEWRSCLRNNLPEHAHYTSWSQMVECWWYVGECPWECDTNYTRNWSWCTANVKHVSCWSAPSNAMWVNSTFTQVWSGNSMSWWVWSPSTHYKTCTTNNSVECSFVCGSGYICNGNIGCAPSNTPVCSWSVPHNSCVVMNNTNTPSQTMNYYYSNNSSDPCSWRCKENSTYNWSTCFPNAEMAMCRGDLPVNAMWVNGTYISTYSCDNGEWSYRAPKYTNDLSSSEACSFTCKPDYVWSGGQCLYNPSSRLWTCTGLPEHGVWLNSNFVQVWSWNMWTPTIHNGTFINNSWIECSFICEDWYEYSNGRCEVARCKWSLPDNALVAGSSIPWSGYVQWHYLTSVSQPEPCSWTCMRNYERDASSNTCKPMTRVGRCSWLPVNAEWINGGYVQVWDWSEWYPTVKNGYYLSTWMFYNGGVIPECSRKCKEGYRYENGFCISSCGDGEVLIGGSCHRMWVCSQYKDSCVVWTPSSWANAIISDWVAMWKLGYVRNCKWNFAWSEDDTTCSARQNSHAGLTKCLVYDSARDCYNWWFVGNSEFSPCSGLPSVYTRIPRSNMNFCEW